MSTSDYCECMKVRSNLERTHARCWTCEKLVKPPPKIATQSKEFKELLNIVKKP